MLMGVFGNVGEGKTLLLAYMAYKFHQQNILFHSLYPNVDLYSVPLPIYANFKVDYPECEVIGVSRLLDLESLNRGLLCIDEAYAWIESRVSQSRINRYVSYFGFQSRKRGVDIVYTAQLGSSIDVRFIDLSHVQVLARHMREREVFQYKFLSDGRVVAFELSYDVASKFWNDYDTSETIEPLGLRDLQVDAEKFNNPVINDRVDSIVSRFIKYKDVLGFHGAGDVFKYTVEDIMLLWNEPLTLSTFVYNRLKNTLRQYR